MKEEVMKNKASFKVNNFLHSATGGLVKGSFTEKEQMGRSIRPSWEQTYWPPDSNMGAPRAWANLYPPLTISPSTLFQ